MNFIDIKQYDVANGPGVRISIFVSGCDHHCKGCFNETAWDFNSGDHFTKEIQNQIIEYMDNPHISGITFLGGEPMEPINQEGLLPLAKEIKVRYPDKTIWCFTGYDFNKDIMDKMYHTNPTTRKLLSYIDVIVDGKFIDQLKDLNLRFKGSSNQRTIMVQESLINNTIVLWEPPKYDY